MRTRYKKFCNKTLNQNIVIVRLGRTIYGKECWMQLVLTMDSPAKPGNDDKGLLCD